MNAQQFYGGADGPDLEVDRATDGTPLVSGRGWTCGRCEAIWVTRGDAEACCVAPGDANRTPPVVGWRLRLYAPE